MNGIEYISIWALSTPLWVIEREKPNRSPKGQQNSLQIRALIEKRGAMARADICGALAHLTGVDKTISQMLSRGYLEKVGDKIGMGRPLSKAGRPRD